MKKSDYILSFFYPVTVETTGSTLNPVLEVVLSGGKYSLNSENSNYSYGSLHSLFKRIFRRLKLNWNNIGDVLILGFGAGGIAEIIKKYKRDCIIDGVEIDKKVIELGEKYFRTGLLKNMTIHCTSADQFLENCIKKFDLIVIDVYNDMKVPDEIETENFVLNVRNALKNGGIVIFNKYVYDRQSREQIQSLSKLYQRIFNNLEIMTVMLTGKIFIAKKLI